MDCTCQCLSVPPCTAPDFRTLLALRGLFLLALLAAPAAAQDFADLSGQVIDAATRQPVAGARVVLLRLTDKSSYSHLIFDTPLSPDSPAPDSPVFSVETPDTGHFRIRTTTPATFMLFVSCPGYVKYGMDFETQRSYSVESGHSAPPISVELSPVVSVLGRVLDAATGAPLPGMTVDAMRWMVLDGARVLLQAGDSASTGPDGSFEIKGLRSAEYVLQVSPQAREKFRPGGTAAEFRDHIVRDYARTWYPGVERREEAAAITPLPGAPLDRIDIKVGRRRTAAIRGRILAGEDAEALGEIQVSLGSIEQQGTTTSYRSMASGKFRAGDAFLVDNLAPGRYWVHAAAGPLQAFSAFETEDRNIDNLDLHLNRGATVAGLLRFDEPLPGPLSARLDGATSPKVSLWPEQRSHFDGDRPAPVALADGSFRLEGVLDGVYRVMVSGLPPGLAAAEVLYNGARVPRRVFTLNPGALTQKLEVVLKPATASLSVSVRDGSDPAPNSIVVLLPEDYDPADPQASARALAADATGHATFVRLLAGKYKVLAYPPGTAWRTLSSLAPQVFAASEIILTKGAAASLDVKPLSSR